MVKFSYFLGSEQWQPEEIIKLVEQYNKDLKKTEGSYLDIVIRSEGAFSYKDIMEMPVNSIQMLIERMNNRVDEQNKANKAAMSKR